MPHERPVPEQRAVLLEELVPQPVGQVLLLAPRLLEQLLDLPRRPSVAERSGQHLLNPIRRWRLTSHRRQTHDPIRVRERVEIIRLGLLRPPIPDQPRHRHLQRRRRYLRPPVEQPLRRIIRPRLGQGTASVGDLSPMVHVERNLDERSVRDSDLLINLANGFGECRRAADTPRWQAGARVDVGEITAAFFSKRCP